MNYRSFLDELVKLSAISDEQARRAADRLDSLDQNKPSAGQVARYATLGAAAGPAIHAVGSLIEHGKPDLNSLRQVGGLAAKGAIAGGAVPMVRQVLDRRAEQQTLKGYLKQEGQ